jgi:hypothetical protein
LEEENSEDHRFPLAVKTHDFGGRETDGAGTIENQQLSFNYMNMLNTINKIPAGETYSID